MLLKLFFWLCLIGVGCYAISKEKELVRFERAIVKRIKRFLSKPEKVIVLPGESEESKKARFETGAAAGNELYAMGGAKK